MIKHSSVLNICSTDEALHVLGLTADEFLREGELDIFLTKLDFRFYLFGYLFRYYIVALERE